jgi:hypothetical protein
MHQLDRILKVIKGSAADPVLMNMTWYQVHGALQLF